MQTNHRLVGRVEILANFYMKNVIESLFQQCVTYHFAQNFHESVQRIFLN